MDHTTTNQLLEVSFQVTPEWRSGLRHRITELEVSLPTWVQSQLGRNRVMHELAQHRLGLASWDVLVPSPSSDSLWRAGRMHTDFGRQLYNVFEKLDDYLLDCFYISSITSIQP